MKMLEILFHLFSPVEVTYNIENGALEELGGNNPGISVVRGLVAFVCFVFIL